MDKVVSEDGLHEHGSCVNMRRVNVRRAARPGEAALAKGGRNKSERDGNKNSDEKYSKHRMTGNHATHNSPGGAEPDPARAVRNSSRLILVLFASHGAESLDEVLVPA